MKKILKFFKILKLFFFCVQSIYYGFHIRTEKMNLNNFKNIWKFCEQWENGDL